VRGLMQRHKRRDFQQKLEIAGGETASFSRADDAAHVEGGHRQTTVGMRAQPPNRERRAENGANLNVAFFEPERGGLRGRVIALREGRRRTEDEHGKKSAADGRACSLEPPTRGHATASLSSRFFTA